MAEKRMFAKSIVLSDAFLDMPATARCLYFTLGMLADDDGFINSPRSIMRQIGASDDDMKILIAKKFVIIFDTGVIVIKHWRINNYLRNDRYTETKYTDEKQQLIVEKNGAYKLSEDGWYTNGIPSIDKSSKDKISIDKNSTERFEEFWSLYPKKADKKKALSAFEELNPDEDLFNKMKDAVKDQMLSDQWQRGFVPNATTWIKNERWNDVLEKAKSKKPVCMERSTPYPGEFGTEYLKEVN